VLFDFLVERAPRDSQSLGCGLNTALLLYEHLLNMAALNFQQRSSGIVCPRFTDSGGVKTEITKLEDFSIAEQQGALQYVAQLSYIAGPWVCLKGLLCIRR